MSATLAGSATTSPWTTAAAPRSFAGAGLDDEDDHPHGQQGGQRGGEEQRGGGAALDPALAGAPSVIARAPVRLPTTTLPRRRRRVIRPPSGARSAVDEADLAGPGDRLGARGRVELAVDRVRLGLDRVRPRRAGARRSPGTRGGWGGSAGRAAPPWSGSTGRPWRRPRRCPRAPTCRRSRRGPRSSPARSAAPARPRRAGRARRRRRSGAARPGPGRRGPPRRTRASRRPRRPAGAAPRRGHARIVHRAVVGVREGRDREGQRGAGLVGEAGPGDLVAGARGQVDAGVPVPALEGQDRALGQAQDPEAGRRRPGAARAPRRGARPPRRGRRAGAARPPPGSRRPRTTRCRSAIDRARAASRAVCAMPWRPIAARTARIAPTTCGGAAPGAASRARCAAASQRSATSRSPRATRRGRGGERQDRPRRDLLLVQPVQPPLDRAGRALPGERRHGAPEQARRPVGVAGRDRVVERRGQVALLLVPDARAAVDLELQRGSASQAGAQRTADEGWTRNCSSERSSAVTGRPARASRRRVRPVPRRSRTASQSRPDSRSSGAVRSSSERSSAARSHRSASST